MKEIRLTQGQKALVDDEDYDNLIQYMWFARRADNTYYAHNRKLGDMHRFLLSTPDGQEVDHKDFNGLNNQRSNIRNCSKSQNNANRRCKNPSGYKGVYRLRYKHKEQWQARITVNGQRIDLGYYPTKEQAANAYNDAALNYFGSFAKLNSVDVSHLIKIKPINEGVICPLKHYQGDAAYDVFNNSQTIVLGFGERYKFNLGFSMEMPSNWVAIIQEKSGMAANNGIITMGNIIDSNYRGECHAILCNLSQNSVKLEYGQKIAQMLIMPCYTGTYYEIVDELTPSNRGTGGFGSTGLEAKRNG